MKKLSILFSLILANAVLFAQNDYYWYKNQKVFLEKIPNKKYLVIEGIKDGAELKQKLNFPNAKVHKFDNTSVFASIKPYKQNTKNEKKWAVVENQNIGNVKLAANKNVIYEAPFYNTSEKKEAGLSHLFYVKLLKADDVNKLEELAVKNNVEILGNNKFMSLWFTLSCSKNSKGNALEMANLFYESGLFAASEPDLMTDDLPQCVNDTYFNNQWGLLNTGQNGGTVGSDINVCQAWSITKGSDNIIVAVLDQGIELNHPDLLNIHPYSYDTESGTSPSQVLGDHGTACSGIIGAGSDNNLGISGIAPGCPLMSVSNSLAGTPNSRQKRADGFNFAWQNGASVISNSWGSGVQYQIIDDAITDALTLGRNGLGCIIVFASGNNNSSVSYPANSNPDIIVVGALSPCEQRKNPSSCDGEGWGSNYGAELDIMAPGVLIPTTDRQGSNGYDPTNYTQTFNGTSSATPHVAAVAALILSVNHNLTRQQVTNIIESTSQKFGSYTYTTTAGRPNGIWNNEMGYGALDAEAAVLMAQSMCTSTKDLYSKDWNDDFGFEPNTYTNYPNTNYPNQPTDYTNPYIWVTEDIWVRNQPDGLVSHGHQDPEFSSTNDPAQLNYIYVRIRNRGCVASDGTEVIEVRWAKANTALNWPENWDGSTYLDPPTNNALAGNLIGTTTISQIIPPGGSVIVELTTAWNPPDPDTYQGINDDPWHFCLLSRILDPADPVYDIADIGSYVTTFNNIAWKNMTVVNNDAGKAEGEVCPDELMGSIGVAVAVGNPGNQPATFNVAFSVPNEELSAPVTEEGNVMVALDEQLYEKWVQGGKRGTGFKEILSPPMSTTGENNNQINNHSPILFSNRKMFEIIGTSTNFNNITLDAKEYRTTTMMVLYPANPVSEKQQFKYDIVQQRTADGKIIGGVRYVINKPTCSSKSVDAGNNQTINRGCFTTLSVTPEECTAYFWLDENGNIISQNSSITISPNKTTTYTLKAVSSEGCISQDQVTVSVSNQICIAIEPPGCFREVDVSPNPVGGNELHVKLIAEERTNINISLTNMQGRVMLQDIVPIEPGPIDHILPLNKVPVGVYKLIIKCKEKSHEEIITRM